ncbi:24_t:CDS:2, partial [Gigaspora rosea]
DLKTGLEILKLGDKLEILELATLGPAVGLTLFAGIPAKLKLAVVLVLDTGVPAAR